MLRRDHAGERPRLRRGGRGLHLRGRADPLRDRGGYELARGAGLISTTEAQRRGGTPARPLCASVSPWWVLGAVSRRNHLGLLRRLPHNPCIKEPTKSRRLRSRHAAPEPEARTDGRIERIVRLLTDHAMMVISGTKLAEEIGASRSAVWRFVQQLRGLGVEITGHPATGYQLKSVPDLLLPEFVKPLAKGTIFAERLHHYFRVGSTNAEAMNAAAHGEPEGSVFLAEQQTAGRGRGGHSWLSEKSAGVYCSVVLRPETSPADTLAISLAAGLAVRAAVQEVTSLVADLR